MKLRKLENIAVIAFIIFSLVLTIIPNRVSAADTTLYLGIVEKRDTEEFGYAISDPNHGGSKLWRILEYQGLNSTALKTNGKKNIYCLREGFGFSDTKKKAEYNLKFDMKTQRDDISKESTELAKTVTNSSYNELLALGDLLYLFGSTSAEREAYLEAAGISEGTFWDVMITDGDIEAVQQAAIWYFTYNGNSTKDYDKTDNTHWLNYTKNGTDYDPLASYYNILPDDDIDEAGLQRTQQAERLYKYLIKTAKENASQYSGTSTVSAPATLTTTSLSYETKNDNYVVGPIKITESSSNSIPYTIDLTVKINGVSASDSKYSILNETGTKISKTSLKSLAKQGKSFYISVPKDGTTSVSVYPKINYTATTLTLWTAKNGTNATQPVMIPERESKTTGKELTVNPEEPVVDPFDLALRKYITKVETDGKVVSIATRVPSINKATISTSQTATYKHRKDPVIVKKGSIVTYNITIYNEGSKAGRATEIIDQLPAGLKFLNVVGTNPAFEKYQYSETDNNTLVLRRKSGNENNLSAYTGGTLASETIQIQCEVTATPDNSNTKILTNVAWISKEYDAVSNIVITNQSGADRDSEPLTKPNVNQNNMENYKGYTGNKTDLADPDYFYKGEQDDDDFEKLKLLPETFDLALRKYITKVKTDGNVVSIPTRVPSIDKSTIESEQTATYKHRKDPVIVKKGSIVTYNITIYNEGDKAGRATEIIDQLPKGLKFLNVVGENPIFEKYQYNETSDNTLVLRRKSSNQSNLSAYTGGNLASETIQIECEVTATPDGSDTKILTNVAWISEEYDAVLDLIITNQSKADRDSEPSTKPSVNQNNMENYKGHDGNKTDLSDSNYFYKGKQDDDDFEKLQLLPETFDLALRKYITQVKTDGNVVPIATRVPSIDKSTIESEQTATYKHKKDPVIVKKGSIVTYNITIYNEGDKAGRATEIIDQLPKGLKFLNVVGENPIYEKAQYNETENNTLVLRRKAGNENNLPAYKGGNLASETIQIECEVTAMPDRSDTKILTNVAWISKEYDAVSDIEITNQPGADRDSEPSTKPSVNQNNMEDYKGHDGNKTDLSDSNYFYKGKQDDDDFEKLQLLPETFDLKLIKNITEVNKKEVPKRLLSVDVRNLNRVGADNKTITTAEYAMNKNAYPVTKGSIITYRLRVYNEGTLDGYASEITEDIPEGLEFIWSEKVGEALKNDNTLTAEEKEAVAFNQKYLWGNFQYDENKEKIVKISTRYLDIYEGQNISEDATEEEKDAAKSTKYLIKAFDDTKGYSDTSTSRNPDYREVYVKMKVTADAPIGKELQNEAWISDDSDEDGNPVSDRDSRPEEWTNHEEDDEDYDKVIISRFDLALRKFITKIENKNVTTRIPQVIYENDEIRYSHDKTPLRVATNNVVTYTIRVFNEGDIDGYASEITDDIPEGLEFLPENATNKAMKWKMIDAEGKETNDVSKAVKITTRYLDIYEGKEISENATEAEKEAAKSKKNLLKAFRPDDDIVTEGKNLNPDYRDVKVAFKVTEPNSSDRIIINSAQISDDSDEDGNEVDDKDSTPDEWNEGEDDQDKEYIELVEFDLALRKFITKIDTKDVTTRIPQVIYENDEIRYSHDKTPLRVVTNNVVTYTIRVFNEGEIDGYASEITDDIPEGLEFLPENATNKEMKWKMIDAEGKETNDVSKAVKITTRYLDIYEGKEISENATEAEKEKAKTKKNLLKAFRTDDEIVTEGEELNPDYRDVKVAFKVIEPNSSDRIIINSAQISDDSDEDGNEIDDKDSTPDEWNEGEDDQDKEYIELVEFDLALRKWVTQAIVKDSKGTTVTNTGHQPYDDPEQVVKVELNKNKINQVTVKFKYSIRVINEGDIEGYAKEITDYVPEGLKFIASDNPGWTDEGNNVISTRLLQNTLLKPGEYADVEVILTWVNDKNNMGVKTNTAEISEDYNEYHVPDKDSTPDNKKPGEDDIDDAPVMLSVATGRAKTYFALGFIVLVTVAGGVASIKKYVL